jgi:hypothetical protein
VDEDIKAYRARWEAVAEIERQEMRAETLDQRWQQLNAVIGLAIELGMMKADQSEEEVYQRWAKLKSEAEKQNSQF